MHVESIFSITGRGTVLAGRLNSGQISIGDRIEVCSPTIVETHIVSAIEEVGTRKLLKKATAGESIAVLLKDLEPARFPDGIEKLPPETFGYKVLNLSIRSGNAPWWKFWQ